MAAKVVDLPEPVGPVTTTRPRWSMANFFSTAGGMVHALQLAVEAGLGLVFRRKVQVGGLLPKHKIEERVDLRHKIYITRVIITSIPAILQALERDRPKNFHRDKSQRSHFIR